jgi:hypothetical protein
MPLRQRSPGVGLVVLCLLVAGIGVIALNRPRIYDSKVGDVANGQEDPKEPPMSRTHWRCTADPSRQWLYDPQQKAWFELDVDGKPGELAFIEQARTPEYVEAYDATRDMTIRIFDDRVQWTDKDHPFEDMWEWKTSAPQRGSWVR